MGESPCTGWQTEVLAKRKGTNREVGLKEALAKLRADVQEREGSCIQRIIKNHAEADLRQDDSDERASDREVHIAKGSSSRSDSCAMKDMHLTLGGLQHASIHTICELGADAVQGSKDQGPHERTAGVSRGHSSANSTKARTFRNKVRG